MTDTCVPNSSTINTPEIPSKNILNCSKTKPTPNVLSPIYNASNRWEVGVDEAGRGPLFGRLYVAGAILPKDDTFQHATMKDSKRFHSHKKIKEASDYIKEHALAWHVEHVSEDIIDTINIRQAVLRAMHECCRQCIQQIQRKFHDTTPHSVFENDVFLLIDGNDFIPFRMFDENTETLVEIPHDTIESGDNTYTPIAAASILAKVARDEYISELCAKYPELDHKYGIGKNKGYGTKQHLDGIREHGTTQWHRKSFGICKTAPVRIVA